MNEHENPLAETKIYDLYVDETEVAELVKLYGEEDKEQAQSLIDGFLQSETLSAINQHLNDDQKAEFTRLLNEDTSPQNLQNWIAEQELVREKITATIFQKIIELKSKLTPQAYDPN